MAQEASVNGYGYPVEMKCSGTWRNKPFNVCIQRLGTAIVHETGQELITYAFPSMDAKNPDEYYIVYFERGSTEPAGCTCGSFINRHKGVEGGKCKHMVIMSYGMAERQRKQAEKRQNVKAQRTPASVSVSPELAAIMPDPVKLAEQRRKRRAEEAAAEEALDESLGLKGLMRRRLA